MAESRVSGAPLTKSYENVPNLGKYNGQMKHVFNLLGKINQYFVV